MASEAVVSYVVGKLGDLLIEEARLLSGVRGQFKWLEGELKRMQCFLKDADAKQKGDEKVRNWVAEVREISYAAEDVIDTFILNETAKIVQKRRGGLIGRAKRSICVVKELRTRHKVGKEILRIQLKIADISRSLSTYGIRDINDEGQKTGLNDRRRSSALYEEADVVGLQEDMTTLKEQLINEEARRRVISIVGMGGSGKTTLAKKVYRDVKGNFDCHAIIYLSQQYKITNVLINIIECVMSLTLEEKEKSNEQVLREKLHNHLSEKRYLLVIDDIWTVEAWDELKPSLPDGLNRSRVLLTTRNKEVALYADPRSNPHDIGLLSNDESWELFLKRIFPVGNTSVVCPPELEETGRKILEKCCSLPLAIVVLGGLLSTRDKTSDAWSRVLQRVTWHLAKGSNHCMEILALSYYDLPHYLKPCFLYLGLFPEDYEIRSNELIRLWVAEGFIQKRDNEIMEDVAQDYLEELIGRSMIQVVSKRSNGSVSRCRIHDLLRDLSSSEGRETSFFAIDSGNGTTSSATVRRLALCRHVPEYEIVNCSTASLRTMFCFSRCTVHLPKLLDRGGKLLRVLHLHDASFPDVLPNEIGEELHLRYLSMRHTEFPSLPPFIGNLSNLQALILRLSGTLPNAIWDLVRLRHLYAYNWDIDGLPRLNNLRKLQTLCLRAGSWIEDGLNKLTDLRKLGIIGDVSPYHSALSEAIEKLCNLRSVKVCDTNSVLPFMSFAHHPYLYKIYLSGRIENLPDLPSNLAKLTLCDSRLQQDAIKKLEKLPNLRVLRLRSKSYSSEKMICPSEGFSRLELLELDCTNLKGWIVEEGAMTSLKRVKLFHYSHLKTLPKQVHHLLK